MHQYVLKSMSLTIETNQIGKIKSKKSIYWWQFNKLFRFISIFRLKMRLGSLKHPSKL